LKFSDIGSGTLPVELRLNFPFSWFAVSRFGFEGVLSTPRKHKTADYLELIPESGKLPALISNRVQL